MSWLDDVRKVFNNYNIPEYIWHPIMQMESGGNPNSHNPNGEDSRGLFQINIKANPKYQSYNLFDPVTNAEIAARDFISPAYSRGKTQGLAGEDLTAYTWKNGIRLYWTEQKNQAIRAETKKYLNGDIVGGAGSDGITATPTGAIDELKDSTAGFIIFGLLILALVAVFIAALYLLFKPEEFNSANLVKLLEYI